MRCQDRWAAKPTTRCCRRLELARVAESSGAALAASRIDTMKIALGVTGGIAAYKAAEIVRLLQDRGVRCRSS